MMADGETKMLNDSSLINWGVYDPVFNPLVLEIPVDDNHGRFV